MDEVGGIVCILTLNAEFILRLYYKLNVDIQKECSEECMSLALHLKGALDDYYYYNFLRVKFQ